MPICTNFPLSNQLTFVNMILIIILVQELPIIIIMNPSDYVRFQLFNEIENNFINLAILNEIHISELLLK